jgi:aspartyl-tRNA(Asn)/glutamyl-tRNA(Gln) amidotransferase subunit A
MMRMLHSGIMSRPQVPRKEDVLYSTVPELGQLLRTRKLSCKELTLSYIDRIKQFDLKLNSFVLIVEERAIQEAERIDREMQHGTDLGPLHGIPFAVKDLFATKGFPTRWGSKIFSNQVFDYDATVVARLRDAGAVLVGKLNMIELAGGTGYRFGSASAAGATHNPWDISRWAGGSSSGSGAAVAAGFVGFAMGSETWGSILVPSAFCGITGFRPSYGRVSRYGVMANSWTLDKVGPMARSAQDCMFVMNAINGVDPKDPTVRSSWRFTPPKKSARIGVLDQPSSDISKLVGDAIDVLRKTGHDVQEIKLPDLPYAEVTSVIQRAEACAAFWPIIRDGRLNELSDEGLKTSFAAGVDIRAIDYLQANRMRAQIEDAAKDVMAQVDVIVAPTLPIIANKLEEDLDKAFGQVNEPLGPLGNLLGWPALSVPCGFSKGLPVGMLVLGAYGQEDNVLSIGIDYQESTDWHKRRPPL